MVLAVDIQVEHVAIAFVGLGGQILGRNSWNLHGRNREPGEVITHIVDSATVLAGDLGCIPSGAGVSVPGVVRRADGHVHEAPNLRWTDIALGERLTSVLRVPVLVGNDAELGAVAEHLRGSARGSSDAVYVSADVGVGGGVIAEGASLRGAAGYVGELGHMVIRPGGRGCYCGSSGCWETEVGEAALCRALGLPEDTPRGAILVELKELAQDAEAAVRRLGSSPSGSPWGWSTWSTCSARSSSCSATCSPCCRPRCSTPSRRPCGAGAWSAGRSAARTSSVRASAPT